MASMFIEFPCRVLAGFSDLQCARSVPIASSPYLDRSAVRESAFGAFLGSKIFIADMTSFEEEKREEMFSSRCAINGFVAYS